MTKPVLSVGVYTQFPPMMTSYITAVHWQTQEIDIDSNTILSAIDLICFYINMLFHPPDTSFPTCHMFFYTLIAPEGVALLVIQIIQLAFPSWFPEWDSCLLSLCTWDRKQELMESHQMWLGWNQWKAYRKKTHHYYQDDNFELRRQLG